MSIQLSVQRGWWPEAEGSELRRGLEGCVAIIWVSLKRHSFGLPRSDSTSTKGKRATRPQLLPYSVRVLWPTEGAKRSRNFATLVLRRKGDNSKETIEYTAGGQNKFIECTVEFCYLPSLTRFCSNYRSPSLRSPSNMFVANLAIADFGLNIFAFPLLVISSFNTEWVFGKLGTGR